MPPLWFVSSALDPAYPYFGWLSDQSVIVSTEDAEFVDVVHVNSGHLYEVFILLEGLTPTSGTWLLYTTIGLPVLLHTPRPRRLLPEWWLAPAGLHRGVRHSRLPGLRPAGLAQGRMQPPEGKRLLGRVHQLG